MYTNTTLSDLKPCATFIFPVFKRHNTIKI